MNIKMKNEIKKLEEYTKKLEYLVGKVNHYNERAKIQGSPHFNMQAWNAVFASWYIFRIELLNSRALDSDIEIPKINRDNNGRFILEKLEDKIGEQK